MAEKLNDHSKRAHALLSASSSARWLACPPSAVAAEMYPSADTDFTREGTLAHEVAEYTARTNPSVHFDLDAYLGEHHGCDQEMIECAQGYRDYIQEQIKSDSAVILLEQRVDFSPWVPDGFGTADCIIIQSNTMDVIDYKYGKGVAVSATDNPQLKLYGLGALNDFGFVYDIETVRLHIYQPRLNNISTFEINAGELRAWAEMTVKPTAEKAAEGGGDFKPGEHCRFCQHARRCRALAETCTELVNTHGLEASVPVLAPWEIADILSQESMITQWLKQVREHALTTMLDGGEIPGYKVVAGRGSRGWADNLEVAAALKKAGYTQEEITKTELLSVSVMEKTLGKKKVATLVGGQILSHKGAPTVVPQTDKRPPYDNAADFTTLD
jgi:hypothetical protein